MTTPPRFVHDQGASRAEPKNGLPVRVGRPVQAVLIGMLIVVVGMILRNLLFAANLRYFTRVPWAGPLTAAYLLFSWR